MIVAYNSAEVIGPCLEALAKWAPEMSVTVIDNASVDGTVDVARGTMGVEIVANRGNRGFAGAANQAFQISHEEVVLLLNPDVRVGTRVEPLVAACATHGLAAGVLTDEAGVPQKGFSARSLPTASALVFELLGVNRLWPSNPVNRRYRYLDRDLETAGPVEQPAGAFLMIRRDVWERLGGFDEGFHPAWFEDVDFCQRALEAGYRIELVPVMRAVHDGGHSVNRLTLTSRTRFWYGSLLRYAGKHFGNGKYGTICLAAMISVVPRICVG